MRKSVLLFLLSLLVIGASEVNANTTYSRRIVMEEATGTWCGYCVRGIETIKRMSEQYPDNFIGIGLHYGDEMDNWVNYGPILSKFTGFPTCIYNRDANGPVGLSLGSAQQMVENLMNSAVAKIEATAAYASTGGNEVTVKTETVFGYSASGASHKIAYVVLEDQVGPYSQYNYYSGDSSTPSDYMYEWCNRPGTVSWTFNDVARGIFPSASGLAGSVPSTLVEGETYTYEYTFALPGNIDNNANVSIVVLLLDGGSGEILNAAKCSIDEHAAPAPSVATVNDYSRVYGEENPEFDFVVSGPELVGTPAITCEATAASPVGTYPIVIQKGSVTNGNVTFVNGTLTITPAPLIIYGGEYTKRQGEENPEFTLTYEGFKNNETPDVLTKQPEVTCEATAESAPGDYPIVVTGAEAENYEITCVNGSLTVTDADPVLVIANDYTITYGDALPTFEYSVSGTRLAGTPEITCEATAASPVGTYPIVIQKGSVTNYNDTYVNGTLTIVPAPLTIKAGEYTKMQGEQNPEFTLTYEGFKNNETNDVLTKQPEVVCEATTESAPGEYIVTVSGAEAQNYEITYVPGKLTIVENPNAINSMVLDGQSFDVYDVQGRKVRHNATSLSDLPKGVYIVNGRKTVLK